MDSVDYTKLGDIITLHRGYDLPHSKRRSGSVPVFGSSGISGWHDEAKINGECVITGRCGTIGEVFYFEGECFPLNTTLFVSDYHGNDPYYAACILKLLFAVTVFDGGDKSATPGIDRNVIHQVELPFVRGKEQQKKLVAPIKRAEELIANKERQMVELEATARLIYDYWFTQFDFPDENGKPYRSSGGKMVWSEELKRDIPEGWRTTTLGEACVIRLGGTPDTDIPEYWDGDIQWLSSAEIANNPILESEKSITASGRKKSATEWSPAGSVTLSITRYIRAAILAVDSCYNQSVVALEENDLLKKEFLYPFVVSQIPRYMVLRTGAQQPHINKDTVAETVFACPPCEVLEPYYEIVAPLYEHFIIAAKEIKELTSLRDWLLPMLMSGQATIGDTQE